MPVTRNQSNASSNTRQAVESASSSTSKENVERGEASVDRDPPRRDSPDNCSICLGPFSNKSFTSSCAHSFCFVCLKQWSKVKAECPLCKQPFTSIFHNIRSNDSYDIYELPPHNPPRHIDYSLYNYVGGNIGTFPSVHQYFNYSQPTLDADLTLSNFSRFQFRRRYDRFLNPHHHPVHGEHQYSYTSSSLNPTTHVSAASWPRGAEDFRRQVYRHHLGPPALILGSENSNYQLTPAMVAASAHRLHRIMPWLTRELRVLLRSHQNVRLAISIIQPLLTQVTINSYHFNEKVSPLIGQKSQQFIQEFVAFANSALNMQTFDRKAMYRRRTVAYEDTSSSSDSEVVEVSDRSSDNEETSNRNLPASSVTNLQQGGWDSPTPGPSWESGDSHPCLDVDRVSVSSESDDPVFRPGLIDSDSENSRAGSDIVFVKYDKPWNERSPIQLSSDSDGEESGWKRKRAKHKKKRKQNSDSEFKKKGRSHKSSKFKVKAKSSLKSKTISVDDPQHESESGSAKKRARSCSPDKQKKKKHKKSKDKNDQVTAHARDRELVDKLFAEAFTHPQSMNFGGDGDDAETPSTSKSKDSSKKGEKEKSKKRKKRKNASQSSASPSVIPSYKKHHSGHKKSTDPSKRDQGFDRRKNRSRHSSREDRDLERANQMASHERNQSVPTATVTHNLTNSFQASYMPMPDTVQHIPLNLWVSTWPVSHTFPAPPSSTAFSQTIVSHAASSSKPPSLILNQPSPREQSSNDNNSQIISSDSSNDSDSDSSNDTSLPNKSRTKLWLEANFSTTEKQQSVSALGQSETSSSTLPRKWNIESLSGKDSEIIDIDAKKSDEITDVVSVESDDDDIVVCSSASSTKSDSDEIRVIETYENIPATTSAPVENNGIDVLVQKDSQELPSEPEPYSETESHISTEAVRIQNHGIFQPFKLQKKIKLAKPNVDPLFSSQAQSSDEDEETADKNKINKVLPSTTLADRSAYVTSEITFSASGPSSSYELNNNEIVLNRERDATSRDCCPAVKKDVLDSISSTASTIPKSGDALENDHSHCYETQEFVPAVTTCSSSATNDTSGSSVFNIMQPTVAVTPMISSSLNYLSYTHPVSSSLSSMIPQALPFVVPPPPPAPPLPLSFTFPHMPSLLHSSSSLFSTVFSNYAQPSQGTASSSGSPTTISHETVHTCRPTSVLATNVKMSDQPFSQENSNLCKNSMCELLIKQTSTDTSNCKYEGSSTCETPSSSLISTSHQSESTVKEDIDVDMCRVACPKTCGMANIAEVEPGHENGITQCKVLKNSTGGDDFVSEENTGLAEPVEESVSSINPVQQDKSNKVPKSE